MSNVDRCRLCDENRPLRESHITPKFVFRYQRETSPLIIRSHINPNRPAQDSRKLRFLCGDCELRLSKWETTFTREVYNPYHAGDFTGLHYGPWLLKFAVSISWRAARATLEAGDPVPPELVLPAKRAEVVWREFLLDQRSDPGEFSQFLYLLDPLAEHAKGDLPINFSSWVLRGSGAGIWHHPGRCTFAWGLLCSVVVAGIMTAPQTLRSWGEHLKVRSGFLPKIRKRVPLELTGMLQSQAEDHLRMSRALSERQQRLDGERLQVVDAADASQYLRAMAMDVKRGQPKM